MKTPNTKMRTLNQKEVRNICGGGVNTIAIYTTLVNVGAAMRLPKNISRVPA